MDDYGSPRSFQLVGLFTTDAWEIVWASQLLPAVWRMWSQTTLPGSPRASHCLSRFQCLDYWLVFLASGGWLFSTRTAAARFHLAWMLPWMAALVSASRALVGQSGLHVRRTWRYNSEVCRFGSLMSDKAPVCLWGAASFGLRQQAGGAACRQWLHVAWAGLESVGRTCHVFTQHWGDQCSALFLSVFYVGWSSQSGLRHLDFPFSFSTLHYSCAS